MIDHLAITVTDIERSKQFYQAVFAPLEYSQLMEHSISGTGFGKNMKPEFWLQAGAKTNPIHIAFSSPDRPTVDAFYKAALNAGASDNGKPGPRSEYHPNYYSAFIHDPDGNNIEAVCHLPISDE